MHIRRIEFDPGWTVAPPSGSPLLPASLLALLLAGLGLAMTCHVDTAITLAAYSIG